MNITNMGAGLDEKIDAMIPPMVAADYFDRASNAILAALVMVPDHPDKDELRAMARWIRERGTGMRDG